MTAGVPLHSAATEAPTVAPKTCRKCLKIGVDLNMHEVSCKYSDTASRRYCAPGCAVLKLALACPGRSFRGTCYKCRVGEEEVSAPSVPAGGAPGGGRRARGEAKLSDSEAALC